MNHVPNINAMTSPEPIYDAGFNVIPEVTRITAATFGRNGSGHAGPIAYLGNGARLYEAFKQSQSGMEHSESDPAHLISVHKSALVNELSEAQRMIILGGGSYQSIMRQELALAYATFEANPNAPLEEIVLGDTSHHFLQEDILAIHVLEQRLKDDLGIDKKFDIVPLCGEFRRMSGDRFDEIMTSLGRRTRDQVRAAVISTGATFGNLENVGTTDSVPVNDIDIQMAKLGEFVSVGDTVMFDYFTMMRNGEGYYNHPALSDFFTNIPVIMRDHCKGLKDFQVNGDSDNQDDIYFSYKAKNLWKARLVAHQLIAEQPQTATISNGSDKVLTIEGEYNVMYSLRPTADIINSRPSENTGLESTFYVSSKELVMHVCKKVESHVSALNEDEVVEEGTLNRSSYTETATVNASRIVQSSRGLLGALTQLPRGPEVALPA